MKYRFWLCLWLFLLGRSALAQEHYLGLGLMNLKNPGLTYTFEKKNTRVVLGFSDFKSWRNTITPVFVDTADFENIDSLNVDLFQGIKRNPAIAVEVNILRMHHRNVLFGGGVGYKTYNSVTRSAVLGASGSYIRNGDTIPFIGRILQQDSATKARQFHLSLHVGFHHELSSRLSLMIYFSSTLTYRRQILNVSGFDKVSWGLTWPDKDVDYSYRISSTGWQFIPISRPTFQLIYRI